MWDVFARSRAMIWSGVSWFLRCSTGFMEQNIRPVLPEPTKPVTFSRLGSLWTMAMYSRRILSIPWKEMSWEATMEPVIRPVSCWGKKPFGMKMYKATVAATVAKKTMSVAKGWRRTRVREVS